MTEPITARQFHFSSGVEDWRVADGGACAFFPTGSFAAGARFVQAVAELPGLDDHAPDVDLRLDGVFVRLFTTAPAQRNRIHLDIWVPHDQAEARVAAGGRVV